MTVEHLYFIDITNIYHIHPYEYDKYFKDICQILLPHTNPRILATKLEYKKSHALSSLGIF